MADLIEIGIEVRTNTVKSATREVDQLGNSVKSAQRSASAFVAAFEQQERQLNKVVEANKRYANTAQEAARASQEFYKAMQQAKLANKDAADSASVFEKRLEQLKLKYNPLYATSRQYETMLNEINEAHRMGALNTQQFEAAQERLNQEFTQGTGAFARYQQQFSQGFNQMGVISQQVGYQVGDFLVQVQSGTNPMVAFGQQATQLLGVLYLLPAPIMATRVAILGLSVSVTTLIASVSIILPLLTAIGAYFLRSSDAAKEAKRGLDEYSSAIERIESKIKRLRDENISFDNPYFDPEFAAIASKRVELANRIARVESESVGLSGRNLRTKQLLLERLQVELDIESQKFDSLKRQLEKEAEKNKIKKDAAAWEEGAAERAETLNARRFNLWWQKQQEKMRAEEELLALTLRVSKVPVYEPLSQAEIAANKANQELINGFESAMKLKEELGEGAYEALRLAGVDMSSPIDDAQKAAAKLATNLGISLELAGKLVSIAAMGPEQSAFNAKIQAGLIPPQARGDFNVQGGETPYELQKYIDDVNRRLKEQANAAKKAAKGLSEAERAAEQLRKELEAPLVSAIDGVSNAFGDFISNGLKDFKGFVSSVLGSFKSMLAQMIATAARNRIMISMGMGGAGTVAGTTSAFAGPLGSVVGTTGAGATVGSGLMGGLGAIGSGIGGVLSGGGLGSSFANLGGLMSGSVGGLGAIGAALPAVGVIALGVSALIGSTKELDSGLKGTIKTGEQLIETFSKIQKKRLFGLIKSTSTKTSSTNALDGIIGDIQGPIMDMAQSLGVGAEAFKNFSYEFNLSLKGLTEEQKMQAITEEMTKMGDSFAAMIPNISGMQELTAVMQQRYQLETRLLQLQDDQEALRQRELDNTNVYNQELLKQIFAEEDRIEAAKEAARITEEAARVERELAAERDRIAQERYNLETRLLQLQEKTTELRNREVAELDASNQALLRQIFALEDSIAAAEEAARVEEELAAERKRIADERYNLETQLLQVQGNTAALRQRELDALDESNRALQNQIWAAEDAAKAIDEMNSALNALQENDFATLLNFQRAQASIRAGLPIANTPNAPAVQSSNNIATLTNPMSTAAGEIKTMREEMKEMHKETMFAYSKMIKNGKDSRDTLRTWDVDGLPAERTA
jgi:hypothetical protein